MLQVQALSIAHLLFLGVTLGMLIDIYRVIIVLIRPGKYLAAAYDLLFWFAAALWVFLYLLSVTAGEVRLYMLLLLVSGYSLEQWILGKQLRASLRGTILSVGRLLSWTIDKTAALLDSILNIIVSPYRFVYRMMLRPLRITWHYLNWPFIFVRTKVRALRTMLSRWWKGDEQKEI